MAIEVDGKSIETTPSGFLTNIEDWSEPLAEVIAKEEGVALTDRHWDVVKFLRDEFINNAGNQPNTRNMVSRDGVWPPSCRNVAHRSHRNARMTADDSNPALDTRLSGAMRPVELTLVQPERYGMHDGK